MAEKSILDAVLIFLRPGVTPDRKNTTPPNQAMAATMCKKARTEMTVGSPIGNSNAVMLVKPEPRWAQCFIYEAEKGDRTLSSKSIRVLRLGQRYVRDDRTLTHLCLVSRALGAESIYLEDAEKGVVKTLDEVNATWGGEFKAILGVPWRTVVKEAMAEGRSVVHLTMYGLPLADEAAELRKLERILLVVGGPKVPGKVYHDADYNVAVTSQPHSEIAALAIALHEIQSGEELKRTFQKSKLKILPSARGKKVVEN